MLEFSFLFNVNMLQNLRDNIIKSLKSGVPLIKRILPSKLVTAVSIACQKTAFKYNIRGGYEKGLYPKGVNLFGYLDSPIGVGQGARLMACALERSGIPFVLINIPLSGSVDTRFKKYFRDKPEFNVNIIHVNPKDYFLHLSSFSGDVWKKRYNIGIWLWELEEFPDIWSDYFNFTDEVWTPSSFNAKAILTKSPEPVLTVPYGIEAEYDSTVCRKSFNLPEDRFLFLSMYDAKSGAMRKNPEGSIEAFKKAFKPEDQRVGLALKTNNASSADLEKLRNKIGDRSNIFIVNKSMEKKEVNSLIKLCDVFVSLHRSEGFGLVMAESMFLGVPCVATGWSANVDFMNSNNSCLVDYELTEVLDEEIYLPVFEGRIVPKWAEPDIDQAAFYMKKLFEDRSFAKKISALAQESIRREFSIEKSADKIKARLDELDLI